MTDVDDKGGIEAFRLLSLKGRLEKEMRGIRFKESTFGAVRREFGFRGNRQRVYDQYMVMLREKYPDAEVRD